MSHPRLILCNGVRVPESDSLRDGRYSVEFNTRGNAATSICRLTTLHRNSASI